MHTSRHASSGHALGAGSGDGVRRAQTVNGVQTRYEVDVASSLRQVVQETRGSNTTRYLYGLDQLARPDSGTPVPSGAEGWAYHHPGALGGSAAGPLSAN